MERYGLVVPQGTNPIIIELACYRDYAMFQEQGYALLSREQHFTNAFRLMWPNYEWSEWVELLVHAWSNYKWISVIGHQRASKSFTTAYCVYLDYCSDPERTLASLSTVTFEGLKLRMWADLMGAHSNASLKFPFILRSTSNEMRVFPEQYAHQEGEKYQIHGMAVSRTNDAQGRIRGGHADRRIIVLDEAQDMPEPIYEAVINPMSAPYSRCAMLSNPIERVSKFGDWCEPEGGWGSVHDTDMMWRTKKGGVCLHFDGLQSPNIKRGKNVFTGLLTTENVEETERLYGRDSVQWWALIRGWFPPDGIVAKIFPDSTIEKGKPSRTWDFKPGKCASVDPAFEYDECVLHVAELGFPVYGERRYAINGVRSETIKFSVGSDSEPKDYQIAHQVMRICKAEGIDPRHFIMDTTGGGRGVYAILQKEWSRDIQSCDYGGSATERPIRADDSKKANEMYQWFVSELWFRAAECMRDGLITGLSNLNPKTIDDLSTRRYEIRKSTKGTLQVAETKDEIKKRLGRSPDHGDALVQFGELLFRLGTMPGGRTRELQSMGRWEKQRQRALRASKVYEGEFATYH